MKIAIPSCMPRCRVCKKPLKNSASVNKGVGPECAQKFAAMLVGAGLTFEALNIPESISTNENVARFLRLAEQALLDRNKRAVEMFKNAAKRAAEKPVLPTAA